MHSSPGTPFVMLHLGLGSFHRAHQALYLHRLHQGGDRRWSIVAGNIRPDMADTLAALQAQGGEYTLETVAPSGVREYERIQSISRVIPFDAELQGIVRTGSEPSTRIVSFTVTEAGYYLDAHHRLDFALDDVAADVQATRTGRPVRTIYGALAAILRARMHADAGPVTLLNCDNLRHNGDRTRAGLTQFLEHVGDAPLLQWLLAHASFPNSMVDRITPRPTAELARRVEAATGRADAAPVMAESFIQWVIEDRFIAGRPAWDTVGVQMVDSVDPYEEAKIRILNATHSCIAWAGTLRGYRHIHEGTRDPDILRLAHAYVTDDVIPVLQPSPIDLHAYRDTVLERFANPDILDTNQRVAMDAFSKIPGFIAPTIRDRLSRGESVASVAMLPALFLAFLQRWHRGLLPCTYEDQSMDPQQAHAICDSADPVAALCANEPLWHDLAGDARLEAAVREASGRVETFLGASSNKGRLAGRHALLTGAGGGIGLAVARAYLDQGARCTVADIGATPSAEAQALLDAHPGTAQYVRADVTRISDIEALVDAARARFGPIGVLFNNAAVFDMAPLLDSDERMYDKLFAVNVKGAFFTMQKVLARMLDDGVQGAVINMASQAGRRGEALVSHYCATKAAVISYTQSAALAMAPHGIRVNAISPGVIDTPMWGQVDALFAKYENLPLGEKRRRVGEAVPLGRMGSPSDICGAAVFLASDESVYVTAQTLNVDGGNVMS